MNIKKNIKDTINENLNNFKFKIYNNIFKLYNNNVLVAKSNFSIENPDDLFDKKYLGIFLLETLPKYRNNGYADILLKYIFIYTIYNLNVDYILLNVYKNNLIANSLYEKNGFTVYKSFDDVIDEDPYYTLIKKL